MRNNSYIGENIDGYERKVLKQSQLANPPVSTLLLKEGNKYQTAIETAIIQAGLEQASQWRDLLLHVCCCSSFVGALISKTPEILRGLISSGELNHPVNAEYYESRFNHTHIWREMDDEEFMAVLRRFRQREMLRIAIRDLLGWATLQETMANLSALADVCIKSSAEKAAFDVSRAYGNPCNTKGDHQQLIILAMGKLGGNELNFSSDVDVIFIYPEFGSTRLLQDHQREIDNQDYFTRVAQRIIKYLTTMTADGFVFRVDTRLRPYGDSGPLVSDFNALEAYYQSQGREWERYAMIKARPLTGDESDIKQLYGILKPFVYRRYLDYGVFESLREMKALIMREAAQKQITGNVKLGAGGIREVEFIGQVFQLIRGGREKDLQKREILEVLSLLAERHVLETSTVTKLSEAYQFLRKVENRLQMVADQQTHSLPANTLDRERLAYAMAYENWEKFECMLDNHLKQVHACFADVFSNTGKAEDDQDQPLIFKEAWLGLFSKSLETKLKQSGFQDPGYLSAELEKLRNSTAVRKMSSIARQRLDRLMPSLIAQLATCEVSNEAIRRVFHFVGAVAGRSVYLALLTEYPQALKRLINFFSASSWLADYVTRHPLLLDGLIDDRLLSELPEKETITRQLKSRLVELNTEDYEIVWDLLRQFKHEIVLRIANLDINQALPLMRVSDFLTELAEVLLAAVYELAYEELVKKFGRPGCIQAGTRVESGMAIIAYGKLGGIELGYNSDLDIVFLHNSTGERQVTEGGAKSIDNTAFFVKFAHKMIHSLSLPTTNGMLYDTDLRLRPDGDSGLVVHSIEGFDRYQQEKAWTWEHQALVRARFIIGHKDLKKAFEQLRKRILCQKRDIKDLRQQVVEMREKMRHELSSSKPDEFDIKQDFGGIVDIEFIVQFIVLAYANQFTDLTRFTDNIRLLECISKTHILTKQQIASLIVAYRKFRSVVHQYSLLNQPAVLSDLTELKPLVDAVKSIWNRLMSDS